MYQKKFLRTFSMMLSVVFLFFVAMTGCGGKAETSKDVTPEETAVATTAATESAAEVEPALEPYTVNYLVIKAIADESDQPVVEEHLNNYLADKLPNTKLKFTFIDGSEMGNKVSMMAAAGEVFDLVMNPWGLTMSQAVAKGIFIPLDDLLNKYGQTILKTIEPKYWPATTIQGKKYVIPHPFVYAQTAAIVFKKDLVEKYNFDYKSVKNIKDLEPFLAAVKKGEPGMTPLLPTRYHYLIDHSYMDYNGWYDVNKNKFIWPYDDENLVDRAKTLHEFYNKGYIPKDLISKIDTLVAECKTGKYAVMADGGIYDESGEKSTNLYGFPTVEIPMYTPLVGTNKILEVFTGISSTSENPERAMMMQDYMYADKTFFNMTCYGKEGLNYEVTANAGTDNPTVKTIENSKWTIWACWTGPLWYQWDSNWNSTKALVNMKKSTDAAAVSPLLGFIQDNEPIKNEIAQLQAIIDEMDKILTNGIQKDTVTYLAEQKAKAQKVGLDKVLAEMEKQANEWKTKNGK